MSRNSAKESLKVIELFFDSIKSAAISLGKIDFPEIVVLEKNLNRAIKINSKKEVDQLSFSLLKKLKPYFYPYLFFENETNYTNDRISKNEDFKKKEAQKNRREKTRIENCYRKISDEMPLSSDSNKNEARAIFIEASKASDRLNEKEEKLNSSFPKFNLPSLEEVKKNEKNNCMQENIQYYQALNGQLLQQYQFYWKKLYECIKPEITDLNDYIRISDFWTRDKLKSLYLLLAEKKYIESGKEDVFVSIFSGFYYDYSDQLPIKWLCNSKYIGKTDTSSNLTLLHYLIIALKDWEGFLSFIEGRRISVIKEFLLRNEKERIVKYFIHGNGEKIEIGSLTLRTNKLAQSTIKDFLSHVRWKLE